MYKYNLVRCTYVQASITVQQLMAGSWSTFPLTISNRPRCGNKAHIAPILVETISPHVILSVHIDHWYMPLPHLLQSQASWYAMS